MLIKSTQRYKHKPLSNRKVTKEETKYLVCLFTDDYGLWFRKEAIKGGFRTLENEKKIVLLQRKRVINRKTFTNTKYYEHRIYI